MFYGHLGKAYFNSFFYPKHQPLCCRIGSGISLQPLPPNLSLLWDSRSYHMGPPMPPPMMSSTTALSSLPGDEN